ncbi:MAG: hypothetical protein QM747_11920 [Nocardioides sp.]
MTERRVSRRGLVASAAWAVPVVSVAAAAPAYSAVSGSGGGRLEVSGQYFVHPWDDGTCCFVPQVVVHNPGAERAESVVVTFGFPSRDFTLVPHPFDPDDPLPDLTRLDNVGFPGYSGMSMRLQATDTGAAWELTSDRPLEGDATLVVGSLEAYPPPGLLAGIDWATATPADQYPVDVSAISESGVALVTSAFLVRVDDAL